MRLNFTLMSMLVLLYALISLNSPSPAQTQENPIPIAQEQPPEFPPPPADTLKILEDVRAAYKRARAFTDTVRVETQGGGLSDKYQWSVRTDDQNSTEYLIPGARFITVKDRGLFFAKAVPDKAYQQVITSPLQGCMSILSANASPYQYHLRFAPGDQHFNDVVNAMTSGMMRWAHVTGHSLEQRGDEQVIVVKFEGAENSAGTFEISPATHFIHRISFKIEPPSSQPEIGATAVSLTCSPKAVDALEQPIDGSLTGLIVVRTMEELLPSLIRVGDAAPDFTLRSVEGQTVTLSSMRGSVVVLDFWSTWCKPCQKSLPLLKDFATWAESSGRPVKVLAVNVWERLRDPELRTSYVAEHWKALNVTVPMVVDATDSVPPQYGFAQIPTTIVIDPYGKIAALYVGALRPDYVEALKADCERMFE